MVLYKERIIAWSCGIGAFMLVLMAGRSCMGTPKPVKNNSQPTGYNVVTPTNSQAAESTEELTEPLTIGYDFFGKPIYATEPSTETAQGDSESVQEEIPENTDFTEATEPTFPPGFDGNDHGNNQEETTAVSTAVENVSTKPTFPPGFDGNDHRVYDDNGNEVATIPSDFVIIFDQWR